MIRKTFIFLILNILFWLTYELNDGQETVYDGFYHSYIDYVGFQGNSSFTFHSPLAQTPLTDLPTIEDLNIGVWTKFTDIQNSTMISCDSSTSRLLNFGINKIDRSVQMIGSFMEYEASADIDNQTKLPGFQEGQNNLILSSWNYFSLFVRGHTIQLLFNNEILRTSIFQEDMVDIVRLLVDESDENSMCELGLSFNGYLRHLVISQNLLDSQNHNQHFMHRLPTPLNENIIAYYQLDSSLIDSYYIQKNKGFDNSKNILTDLFQNSSNEPEFICRCFTQDSNFLQIDPSIGANPIAVHQYDTETNYEVSLTLFITKLEELETIKLFEYEGVFSIDILNQKDFKLQILDQEVDINTSMHSIRKAVIQNYWINYKFIINDSGVQLEIDDFTNTPIAIGVTFQQQLDLDSMPSSREKVFIYGSDYHGYLQSLKFMINNEIEVDSIFSSQHFVRPNNQFNNWIHLAGHFETIRGNLELANAKFFQMEGPCSQTDTQFFFDGIVCKDSRKYLRMNQVIEQSEDILLGSMASSNENMTIEIWFKFEGFLLDDQQKAMIFGNINLLSGEQQTQIYLDYQEGNTKFDIVVIPDKEQIDTLELLQLSDIVEVDKWYHLAIVSNSEQSQLSMYLYDHELGIEVQKTQNNSHFINQPNHATQTSYMGNSYDLDAPFKGYLREFRIWYLNKTLKEIQDYRYQTIPNNETIRKDLKVYVMLNQGFGDTYLDFGYEPSNMQAPFNNHLQFPNIQWEEDLSLVICPSSTFYTPLLKTCVLNDFEVNLTKSHYYNSDGFKMIALNSQVNFFNDDINYDDFTQYFQYEWVIDRTSTSDMDQVKTYLGSNDSIDIRESDLGVNTTYYIRLRVTNILNSQYPFRERVIQIGQECPFIQIKPYVNKEHYIKVSSQLDPEYFKVWLDIDYDCGTDVENMEIQWSTNHSNPDYIYAISQDKTYLDFIRLSKIFITFRIDVTVTYYKDGEQQEMGEYSDFIIIEPVEQPFVFEIAEYKKEIDEGMNIEFSGSYQFMVNYPLPLEAKVIFECPIDIFKTLDDYDTFCKLDENGTFKLNFTDMMIVSYSTYEFHYNVFPSNVGNIDSLNTIPVMYTRSWFDDCPSVKLETPNNYHLGDTYMIFKPLYKLYCRNTLEINPFTEITKYEIQNIDWDAEGYLMDSQFFMISEDRLRAIVRPEVVPTLPAGYFTNVTLSGFLGGNRFKVFSEFNILRKKLVFNANSFLQNVTYNQTLIIDASESYDPDSSDTIIRFKWSCPIEFDCRSLNLQNKNTYELDMWERIDMDLIYGNTYSFQISISVDGIPEKEVSKTVQIKFQNYEYNITNYCNSKIEILTEPQNITFKANEDNTFEVKAAIDTVDCPHEIIYEDHYIILPGITEYDPPGNFLNKNYLKKNKIMDIFAFIIDKEYAIDILYVYQYQDVNDLQIYNNYKVKKIPFIRKQADLVAILSFDQQSSYEGPQIFDSKSSLDPDYEARYLPENSYITYWFCPQIPECATVTDHVLYIQKDWREKYNLNNIGQAIEVKMRIERGNRISNIDSTTYLITVTNYYGCFVLRQSLLTQQLPYDFEYPLSLQQTLENNCKSLEPKLLNLTYQYNTPKEFNWDLQEDKFLITIYNSTSFGNHYRQLKVFSKYSFSILKDGIREIYNSQNSLSLTIHKVINDPVVMTNTKVTSIFSNDFTNYQIEVQLQPDHDILNCFWNMANHQSQDCKLVLSQQQLALSNQEPFKVMQIDLTLKAYLAISLQKVYYLSILSDTLAQKLPQCEIMLKNYYLDLDDKLVFYPECQFVNQQSQDFFNKYGLDLVFKWTLLPVIQNDIGVKLNQRKLEIPQFTLIDKLTNNQSEFFQVQLDVSLSNPKPDSIVNMTQAKQQELFDHHYSIKRGFNLPKIKNLPELYTIQVQPLLGYNLYNDYQITISEDLMLTSLQNLRIRVRKQDNSGEFLVQKTQFIPDNKITVRLPLHTTELYIDIIDGKRQMSNNFTIQTRKIESVTIRDMNGLSEEMILSLLYNPINCEEPDLLNFDLMMNRAMTLGKYSDLVQQSPKFVILNDQINAIENCIETFENYFDEKIVLRYWSNLLTLNRIVAIGLSQNIELKKKVQEKIFCEYHGLDMIDRIIKNQDIQIYVKEQWIMNIQKILDSELYDGPTEQYFMDMQKQIQSKLLIDGEISTNTAAVIQMNQLYKIQRLDMQTNKDIVFTLDNEEENFQAKVETSTLPDTTQFIDVSFLKNEISEEGNQLVSPFLISLEVSNQDRDDILIDNNFKALLNFKVQSDNQDENQDYLCAYQNHQETWVSDDKIYTDLDNYGNGTIICKVMNQGKFGIVSKRDPLKEVQKKLQGQITTNSGITHVDYFKLIAICIYLSISLVLILFGILITQVERTIPFQRFYNKLTMQENVQKYSLQRLVGCMVLQFNPLCNYIFKTNYYMNRFSRLIMIQFYFLVIGLLCITYFHFRLQIINTNFQLFQASLLISVCITLVRPFVQSIYFQLYYPRNLSAWKYFQTPQTDDTKFKKITEDQFSSFDLSSMRNATSMKRLFKGEQSEEQLKSQYNLGPTTIKSKQVKVKMRKQDRPKKKSSKKMKIVEDFQEDQNEPDQKYQEIFQKSYLDETSKNPCEDYEKEGGSCDLELDGKFSFKNKNMEELNEQDTDSNEQQQTVSSSQAKQNYRTINQQKTSLMKKRAGDFILIGLCILLICAIYVVSGELNEFQLKQWISCVVFTFFSQIFLIDNFVYLFIAKQLQRVTKYGQCNSKKFCSQFNWFVNMPLGKWKLQELEIELAKLKDFEKEYDLVVLQ